MCHTCDRMCNTQLALQLLLQHMPAPPAYLPTYHVSLTTPIQCQSLQLLHSLLCPALVAQVLVQVWVHLALVAQDRPRRRRRHHSCSHQVAIEAAVDMGCHHCAFDTLQP